MTTSTLTLDDISVSGPLYTPLQVITGTENADVLLGSGGNEIFYGLGGDDAILGGGGNDTIIGGAGADGMYGDAGVNRLSYVGSDAGVHIELMSDIAFGGHAEGDTFFDIDDVVGSAFDDYLAGDAQNNRLAGGRGNDQMYGEDGRDTLIGGGGGDYIAGGNGNDILRGDNGRDLLIGGAGNDYLEGGAHADTLHGGSGSDTLIGGGGKDTMTGGAGHDTFIFNTASDSRGNVTADVITDFTSGTDTLDLTAISGALTFIGGNMFSGTGAEARTVVDGPDLILRVDVDGDGLGDMRIVLQGIDVLTTSDFLVI